MDLLDLYRAVALLADHEGLEPGAMSDILMREGLEWRLATWGNKSIGDQLHRVNSDHLAAAVSDAIARGEYR